MMKVFSDRSRWLVAGFGTVLVLLLLATGQQRALAAERLQKISPSVFLDGKTGRMWQLERSRRIREAGDAQDFLAELNGGEYDDWRLPTRQELFDLFQAFDLKEFGEVKIQIEGRYWLRTDTGEFSVGSWEIGDGCGPERRYYEGRAGYVRAIRP